MSHCQIRSGKRSRKLAIAKNSFVELFRISWQKNITQYQVPMCALFSYSFNLYGSYCLSVRLPSK